VPEVEVDLGTTCDWERITNELLTALSRRLRGFVAYFISGACVRSVAVSQRRVPQIPCRVPVKDSMKGVMPAGMAFMFLHGVLAVLYACSIGAAPVPSKERASRADRSVLDLRFCGA